MSDIHAINGANPQPNSAKVKPYPRAMTLAGILYLVFGTIGLGIMLLSIIIDVVDSGSIRWSVPLFMGSIFGLWQASYIVAGRRMLKRKLRRPLLALLVCLLPFLLLATFFVFIVAYTKDANVDGLIGMTILLFFAAIPAIPGIVSSFGLRDFYAWRAQGATAQVC